MLEDAPLLPSSVWEQIEDRLEEEEIAEALGSGVEKKALPPDLWGKIELRLEEEQETAINRGESAEKQVKMVPVRRMWQMAAVFALLLVSTVLVQQRLLTQSTDVYAMAQDEETNIIQEVSPELYEAEQYYMAVIQKQKASLKRYYPQKKGLKAKGLDIRQFEEDIKQLDEAYLQLKADLEQSQQHEQVRQAMIQNLQLRMSILNKQLELLNNIEQEERFTTEVDV